jgi:hypothetical protein
MPPRVHPLRPARAYAPSMPNPEDTADDLVTLATFPSVINAEIAKGLLETNGIEAFVANELTGGIMPYLPSTVRLSVARRDEARARELLTNEPEAPPT